MTELASSPLSAWQNVYVIVGPSAATLIGIQFVVIALVANHRAIATSEAIRTFATPTMVHLGGALVVSAVMCAPWPSIFSVSAALAICGLGGLAYGAQVIRRARRQTAYRPVWEDWFWHAILPCSIYAALALAALLLQATRLALFVIAGATLGLLLIGIHNAWDTVTYVVVHAPRADAAGREGPDADRR